MDRQYNAEPVMAGTTRMVNGNLFDEDNNPISGGSLNSFVVTAYENRTGKVVPGWENKDELSSVDAQGMYHIPLPVVVQTPLRPNRNKEWRTLRILWTFNAGLDKGGVEYIYPLSQLGTVTV